jgi:AcrR family transcriptional regulator
MAQVPERAGVAPGLFYQYFGSKDQLLGAVLDAASPRDAFAGLGASLTGKPIEQGLKEITVRAAAMLEERDDVVRVLIRELFRETFAPASPLPPGIVDIQQQVLGDLAEVPTQVRGS